MIEFLKLRCNGLQEPQCIDNTPVFSWNYKNTYVRGITQKYFVISLFDGNDRPVFEKKCLGRAMQYIYKGHLVPLSDYFWQVTARLSNGQVVTSAKQKFSTGLLGGRMEDMGAKWISGSKKYERQGVSFRKSFALTKDVAAAYGYFFTTAWQRVSVNGIALKDDCYLLPPNSSYTEKCIYEKYDLKAALKKGTNELSVLVGGGYNSGYSRWGWRLHCGKAMIGFLDISYTDGTVERICTEENWNIYSSNIAYCDIYNGEHYDATVIPQKLESAAVIASPVKKAKFTANEMPHIKAIREIMPLSCQKNGRIRLYDMGENFAGTIRLSVQAARGTKITLQYSELVYANGKQRTTSNYKAKAQDVYVCSGDGVETFVPRFTYHGFRYINVTCSAGVQSIDITAIALSSEVASQSSFRCADAVVNAIHENAVRSLQSNLMSIPTDCPSRNERTPCAMDSICSEIANIYNFDMHSYYRKWIDDIICGADTADDHGNPDWDGDKVLLTLRLLEYYNDSTVAQKYYKKLQTCMEMFRKNSPDNLWYDGFGDWCHPNENTWETFHSSVPVVNSCLYYMVSRAMAALATKLGKADDAASYASLAEDIQKAFAQKFVCADGTIHDGIHTEQVMALYSGIVSGDMAQTVLDTLCHKLRTESLDLGIFGIMALANVLPKYNKSDLLLEILHNPRYPGFVYQLANGATSLWEVWAFDGRMASHNHAMFAGIEEAFYGGFAGIRPLKNGFSQFTVKPAAPKAMGFVDCTVETASGVIQMAYLKNAASTELKVSVPVNTQAVVSVPDMANAIVYDGEVILSSDKYTRGNGMVCLTLGSGQYHIRIVCRDYLFENTYDNRYIVVD